MDTLPEKQKIILQLRDVEEFEYSEISKMLDINKKQFQNFAINRIRKEFNLEKQQQEFLKFYSS